MQMELIEKKRVGCSYRLGHWYTVLHLATEHDPVYAAARQQLSLDAPIEASSPQSGLS